MIDRIQDGALEQEHIRSFSRDTQAWMFSKEGLPHYIGMELIKKDGDRHKPQEKEFEKKKT